MIYTRNIKHVEIPELKEDEVYISHVGDGEYEYNVFGGVYNDLSKLLNAIYKKFNCTALDLEFFNLMSYNGIINNHDIYISKRGDVIACISVEKLNQEDFSTGY